MKTTPSRKGRPNRRPGEKFKDADGYIRIKMPEHPDADRRGYVREHRIVLENKIGRRLLRREEPHHKNGVRHDNRPENLQLCANRSAHQKIHKPDTFCKVCGDRHFGRGFCLKHYNQMAWQRRKVAGRCEKCGKPCPISDYHAKDGKQLCRNCRWPKLKCSMCDKPASVKGMCKAHYGLRFKVPCANCGILIYKYGRNRWPPVCRSCFEDGVTSVPHGDWPRGLIP